MRGQMDGDLLFSTRSLSCLSLTHALFKRQAIAIAVETREVDIEDLSVLCIRCLVLDSPRRSSRDLDALGL